MLRKVPKTHQNRLSLVNIVLIESYHYSLTNRPGYFTARNNSSWLKNPKRGQLNCEALNRGLVNASQTIYQKQVRKLKVVIPDFV